MITVKCPRCHDTFEVPQSAAGEDVACPNAGCGHKFIIQTAETAQGGVVSAAPHSASASQLLDVPVSDRTAGKAGFHADRPVSGGSHAGRPRPRLNLDAVVESLTAAFSLKKLSVYWAVRWRRC